MYTFSKAATSPNVLCGSSPVQRDLSYDCLICQLYQSALVVRSCRPFTIFPSVITSPSIRHAPSPRDCRSHSRHGMRCATVASFTTPAPSATPGMVSRHVLRILDYSLLWLKDRGYRVDSDAYSLIYLPRLLLSLFGSVYIRCVDSNLLHCF
jgi:hypothetical protein